MKFHGFPAEVQMEIDEKKGKDCVGNYLTVMDAGK
jgi:hypothetical protein